MTVEVDTIERSRSDTSQHFENQSPLVGTRPIGDRQLCIGVAGCGYWGSKHVRVVNGLRHVGAVAIIDPSERVRQSMIDAFPSARAFPDLKSALPHIDALIVAVPAQKHAEIALEAIRHGKHVLVEKPLATSTEDARRMVDDAQRADVILMTGHTFSFNPAVRELKRRMDRGDLGSIYYIHSARLNLGLYRPDVNVVWDLAPHDISIFNYLLQSTPTRVAAWGSSHAFGGLEDIAVIRLEYEERRVTGYIHVSWLDPDKVRRVTVVGSAKMAVYNDMAEERLRIFDRGVERQHPELPLHEQPLSYRYGDIISPHVPFGEPLAIEDAHFIDCIRTGAVPDADGIDGLNVVGVLRAIDESLATGVAVKPIDGASAPTLPRSTRTATMALT
jgi:predicted dehydrogenase